VTGKSRRCGRRSLSPLPIKHADRLLAGPAIRLDYEPGKRVTTMTLESQAQRGGIKLTLQAEDLAGLSEGAPPGSRGCR
jgi:hypothetical protein